jgi:mRNA-degrading endonuclease RelE of RelBE toxin-antitoxin system
MPSLEIEFTPRVLRAAKKLSKSERAKVQEAIDATAAAWGHPHAHAGAGLRRLKANAFECRCGLHLRLIFFAEPGCLVFYSLGNHDDIQALLKTL